MEYFYHYTTLKKWEKIQKEGLQPGRSIVAEEAPDVKDLGLIYITSHQGQIPIMTSGTAGTPLPSRIRL
jgi:hypothetical protein